MGKKYIIELLDECDSKFKGIMVFGLTQEKQISVELIPEESLRPYTEDSAYAHGYTEAESKYREIRGELEKQAYQKGLSDAWDAARKIGSNSMCSLEEMGFDFSQCVINDYNPSWFVIKNYSVSECIEKIRQYEQEKEEIKVGDEVEAVSGKAVVFYVDEHKHKVRYVYSNGVYAFDYIDKVTKTGRHFPEVAAVLEKMRESE